jgi:mRNA-degrading endonuclease RelE of RelBE toxin-antitoxin system
MSWTITEFEVRATLTTTEMIKWERFRAAVTAGNHPKTAAENSDAEYKKIRGPNNQYQISLSKKNRAIFTIDKTNKIVTVLGVGGHT